MSTEYYASVFAQQELVEVNKRKAAQLVCIGFGYLVSDVERMLEHSPDLLYKFLSAIFEIKCVNSQSLHNILAHPDNVYTDALAATDSE